MTATLIKRDTLNIRIEAEERDPIDRSAQMRGARRFTPSNDVDSQHGRLRGTFGAA